MMMENKTKLIIDTDCGMDDAKAIMIAASEDENVEIVAITCVNGNTNVDNVVINVLRTLQACHKLHVPVYKGASLPLMGNYTFEKPVDFHGKDGFGDVIPQLPIPDLSIVGKQHAVQRLVELAREYSGEITLVALGPLTNIALAIRMDPNFATNLKNIFVMGGNSEAQGNVTVCAEANFSYDPEAIYVVLNELKCPITIVPWEMCVRQYLTWEHREELLNFSSKQAQLIRTIEHKVKEGSDEYPGYILCDEFIMTAAIEPGAVVRSLGPVYVSVELHGVYARGQMIIDRQDVLKRRPNAVVVEEIDMNVIDLMLRNALR